MKYDLELDLELARDRVIELFDDPENLKYWQSDLVSFEHVSGEPGAPGATFRLVYRMGKKEVEMIETIVARNLPDEFLATYEAAGVWNRVHNRFILAGENQTRWLFQTEFKCSGFMKIVALFMPGMLKRESLKYMNQFKAFAESA